MRFNLFLKQPLDRWYHWKGYKSEQAAFDAMQGLFSGETKHPDWFAKDYIKITCGSRESLFGGFNKRL